MNLQLENYKMSEEKIYELKDIGLQQVGKSILWSGGAFGVGLIGSFAYGFFINHEVLSIFFHLRNAFIFFILVYGIIQLTNKKEERNSARQFLIKILDKNLTIEIDNTTVFKGPLNELRAIRTLDLSNKKNDVQAQIYIGDKVFSLASSLNYSNKSQFNDFVLCCEKRLEMKIKPVPFSIYTHNFQGIKYLEYFNPGNPLL